MWCGKVSIYSLRLRLSARVHVSWIVAGVAAGILIGIGLSLLSPTVIFTHWTWLLLAVVLALVVFIKHKTWMVILALIAGILVGMFRGTIERVNLGGYADFINQTVTLSGKVFEDPSVGLGGELKLRLVDVVINDTELPGQVWLSTATRGSEIKRSDTVAVEGKLKPGFGTFAASMTYASLADVTPDDGSDPAREVRDAFGEQLSNAISDPAHDLGMGILAGQKTALPIDVSEAFRIAGLTHIVVASGYNLTILIRFARRVFAKISRLAALIGGAASAFGFACVTGFSPSMTRAAMVAGLSLLAWYYGRKFHPVVLLTLVAAVTALINPAYVWGDAGWYMSFMAFAGVIILAPLIKTYFWGREKPKPDNVKKTIRDRLMTVRDIFIETMSAQIMTAPIIALMLGSFAPYGLLANLLVLPIVPLAMLLTFIAGVAGWVLVPLATIIGTPAKILLDYIIEVARIISELPGAIHEVDFGIWPFIGVMTLIVAVIIYMRWRTGYSLRDSNPVV